MGIFSDLSASGNKEAKALWLEMLFNARGLSVDEYADRFAPALSGWLGAGGYHPDPEELYQAACECWRYARE